MGTYATTTSFSTLLIGTELDTATSALLGQCITWSEGEINRKLAKRYDVASFQSSVPPRITSLCEQLTIGYYYWNNSRGGKEGLERGKDMMAMVRADLNELAAGKTDLVNAAGAIIAARSGAPGVLSSTVDYSSTFAEDNPLRWRISIDKLTDIDSNRD